METITTTFEIGQLVWCKHERKIGKVEYLKNGWVGVRGLYEATTSKLSETATLIPQQPSNLELYNNQ